MPLLWKKRNQKIPAPVSCTNTSCTVEIEGGEPIGQGKITQDIMVSFVTQDFNASLHDEISVKRGQVIQAINTTDDDMWLYICDVDGQCGYIPASVSYSINDIQSITGWSNSQPTNRKPKATSMGNTSTVCHNVISSRLNSSAAFPYNNLPTSHIREINRNTPDALCITELSSSPHLTTRLHPLHPLSLTNSASGRNTRGGSSTSKQDGTPISVRPPHSVHIRTQSYQDAIIEPQFEARVLPDVAMERPSRPCDLPLYPAVIYDNNCLTTTTGIRSYTHGSQYDDVFLPSNKKPLGIFKAATSYNKTVPGEVSVHESEYVIVTEIGQGEWAWIITTSGAEGVVPKDILYRYDPCNTRVNIGTQTELIVVAPVSTISRPLSSNPPSRQLNVSQYQQSFIVAEVAVQTDIHSPVIMDVWSQSQTLDDHWYENSMSIPRLNVLSLNGIDSPSICTLPAINGLHDAPHAFHSSRQSLPQLPLNDRQNRNSVEHVERPVATHTVGNVSNSPDITSNFSDIINETQTVVLKAIQSYTCISMQNSNYLSLKKGDILHVNPGSNTVCEGWIWAYHVQQGAHGYVPKSHTAFLCITKQGGIIRYDEV